jgi:hypothetical protein
MFYTRYVWYFAMNIFEGEKYYDKKHDWLWQM